MGAPNIKKVEQESWGEQHPTEEAKLLAAFFKRGERCQGAVPENYNILTFDQTVSATLTRMSLGGWDAQP